MSFFHQGILRQYIRNDSCTYSLSKPANKRRVTLSVVVYLIYFLLAISTHRKQHTKFHTVKIFCFFSWSKRNTPSRLLPWHLHRLRVLNDISSKLNVCWNFILTYVYLTQTYTFRIVSWLSYINDDNFIFSIFSTFQCIHCNTNIKINVKQAHSIQNSLSADERLSFSIDNSHFKQA
jgi:hypothetical protein